MNLFLDAANTDCWADLAGTGLFSGITTNPLLIQRAGLKTSIQTYQTLYDKATKLGYPCIQFQVLVEIGSNVHSQFRRLDLMCLLKSRPTKWALK